MQTILFTGGGTAGHVMPNLALIKELRHEYECLYAGSSGMESRLCAERGIPFFEVETVKLARGSFTRNLLLPFRLPACIHSAKKLLNKIKPDLVFAKGGYVSLPVALAARCPLLCHESDLTPGLATRLYARKAVAVLTAFPETATRFKRGVATGNPLDPAIYLGTRSPEAYGLTGKRTVVGIVGGSSGASSLNGAVIEALPLLTKSFDVIHVTGRGKSSAPRREGYSTVEFENNMPRFYATCDIVVTRAGANALAECAALNKKTVAVPLEKASRGDQIINAKYYADRGAAVLLRERDITPEALTSLVAGLSSSPRPSELKTDGRVQICNIIRKTLSKA